MKKDIALDVDMCICRNVGVDIQTKTLLRLRGFQVKPAKKAKAKAKGEQVADGSSMAV